MKTSNVKKVTSATLAIFSTLLIGCGGGGGSETGATTDNLAIAASASYDVLVERGPVLGCSVSDSLGNIATSKGNGTYSFSTQPSYPIEASGGYIDVDGNGEITSNDRKLDMTLRTEQGKSVTVLTTLAEDQEAKDYLMQQLDVSEEELFNSSPRKNAKIAALSDSIYSDCLENNCSDLKNFGKQRLETLKPNLQNSIQEYEGAVASGGQIKDVAAEKEKQMFQQLTNVPQLTATEMIDAQEMVKHGKEFSMSKDLHDHDFISTTVYVLDEAQKVNIINLYEDKKLSNDIYGYLDETWKMRVFHHITKANKQHFHAIKRLIDKYELDVSHIPQTKGEFSNQERLNQFESLKAESMVSLEKALEVITLFEYEYKSKIEIYEATATEDVSHVISHLKNGSEKHLECFVRFSEQLSQSGTPSEKGPQGGFGQGQDQNGQSPQGGFGQGQGQNGQAPQGGFGQGQGLNGQAPQGGFGQGQNQNGLSPQGGFGQGQGQNGQPSQGGFGQGQGQSGQSSQGGFGQGQGQNGQSPQGGFGQGQDQNGQSPQDGFGQGQGQNGQSPQGGFGQGQGQSGQAPQGGFGQGQGQNGQSPQGGFGQGQGQSGQAPQGGFGQGQGQNGQSPQGGFGQGQGQDGQSPQGGFGQTR
ncbi:MAG: DUF2202 domain-containing protein [Candidatus Cloacimonetes bacterium]|nr:DUF2202 domain-containing protein [Candidatus Cloacimonadota bacterium]